MGYAGSHREHGLRTCLADFQWLGLSQSQYPMLAATVTAALVLCLSLESRSSFRLGRMVYATGSNEGAARLAGIPTRRVKFLVFVAAGTLTGWPRC